MNGTVEQVNLSAGGVPKTPIERAWLGTLGLEGDEHRFVGHGGPERALCLYSLEVIQALQEEGHPIFAGAAGENVTLSGLDWAALNPGDRLRIGEALVELTRDTTPCKNLRPYFIKGDFSRILHDRHPGWSRFYARVVETGSIAKGDAVEVLSS